jgi:hypothetical protein
LQGFNSFKEHLANARRAALEAGADIPDILKKQEAALNRLFKVGGNTAKGVRNATGQVHYLLGNKITRALNNHPTLKGAFDYSRTNSKYIYNALENSAYKGY